jgi:hypothetical protein
MVSEKVPRVSVICPAYREEVVLPRFHEQLSRALSPLGDYRFEIVYVDDGSDDGTLEQMRRLAGLDGRVRYLSLSRNFGKEAALTAGLAHATGDAVITMDTDLQHPPEVIPQLLTQWRGGADIVRTERLHLHQGSLGRRLSAWAFHALMRKLTGNALATSDFQLLSRRVVDALAQMPEAHRYVRGLVSWVGFPTRVVTITIQQRAAGVSRFTPLRLLGLACDGMMSFSRAPLRLCLAAGPGLLLGGILWTAAVVALLLAGRAVRWELHALASLQLFLAGIVLCGLGVVGEYVGRIYEQVKQRPIYLLKESSLQETRPEAAPLGDGPPAERAA